MWLLVHIVTTAYPKSKFFLSSPENQNSLLFMPRKLPFCQMTFVRNLPALNTEETQGHTMKCLSVWDVTVQLGRELTTSDSSFPSQCHIRWNAQSRYPTVQSPGRGTWHTESFPQWLVHMVGTSSLSLFS